MTEIPDRHELAGMALRNGVLVIGPTSWAVAVRKPDGSIVTAARRRAVAGEQLVRRVPMLRGPMRLIGMFATLPQLRRAVPEARFGFESRGLLAGMLLSATAVRAARVRFGTGAVTELVGGVSSLAVTVAAMRGGELAAYHGAEHKAIGGYEQGIEAAEVTKEHPRCGTQLALPMLAFSAAATQGVLALAPGSPKLARGIGQLVGMAAATELFRAGQRGRGGKLAELAAAAGIHLQSFATTAEPDAAQLEIAEAALAELLRAESVTS